MRRYQFAIAGWRWNSCSLCRSLCIEWNSGVFINNVVDAMAYIIFNFQLKMYYNTKNVHFHRLMNRLNAFHQSNYTL